MKCKYPEERCINRYMSHSERREGLHCRLKEWKRKKGTCPYNFEIKAIPKVIRKQLREGQRKLI